MPPAYPTNTSDGSLIARIRRRAEMILRGRARLGALESELAAARTALTEMTHERDRAVEALGNQRDVAWFDTSRRGLFVIGQARSGTTILQNALNSSPEVFLFGEADFYQEGSSVLFRERYNQMHREWGNQETKSTFCPRLFDEDMGWRAYITELSRRYQYVGEKVVVNPTDAHARAHSLFDFFAREFPHARFIFTFRHPAAVFASMQGLASFAGNDVPDEQTCLRCFLSVVRLYIRMLRNFSNVYCVFHEDMSAELLAKLGQKLDISLASATDYYDGSRINTRVSSQHLATSEVQEALAVYKELRAAVVSGPPLLQIEQNDAHVLDSHWTALGRLSRGVDTMMKSKFGIAK